MCEPAWRWRRPTGCREVHQLRPTRGREMRRAPEHARAATSTARAGVASGTATSKNDGGSLGSQVALPASADLTTYALVYRCYWRCQASKGSSPGRSTACRGGRARARPLARSRRAMCSRASTVGSPVARSIVSTEFEAPVSVNRRSTCGSPRTRKSRRPSRRALRVVLTSAPTPAASTRVRPRRSTTTSRARPVAWRTARSSRGAVTRFNSPATQTQAAPRTLLPAVQPNGGSPLCGKRDLTGVRGRVDLRGLDESSKVRSCCRARFGLTSRCCPPRSILARRRRRRRRGSRRRASRPRCLWS